MIPASVQPLSLQEPSPLYPQAFLGAQGQRPQGQLLRPLVLRVAMRGLLAPPPPHPAAWTQASLGEPT